MIKKKIWAGEVTNELGEIDLAFSFSGSIVEIDVDYGNLGPNTKLTVTTSNGRNLLDKFVGNDSGFFPIAPRKTFNEDRYFQDFGRETTTYERYVNVGELKIKFENADEPRVSDEPSVLRKVEIIYEI